MCPLWYHLIHNFLSMVHHIIGQTYYKVFSHNHNHVLKCLQLHYVHNQTYGDKISFTQNYSYSNILKVGNIL